MEIYNLHSKKKHDTEIRNVYAPQGESWRMLLCGPSGCGKTNLCASMIINNLVYDRVYLYSKHLDDEDDVYVDIIKFLEKVQNKIRKKMKDPEFQMYWFGNKFEDIPEVTEFDPNYKNLILIDDFMNEKHQEKVHDLFTSGRHKKLSIMYLSQRYLNTDPIIRANCNYFVLFKVPTNTELRLLSMEQATDMDYNDFKNIFSEAVADPYSFLVIDRKTPEPCLRYRKKFDGLLFNCEE